MGLGWSLIFYLEMRGFEPFMALELGGQAAFEGTADDQGALSGKGGLAGLDHFPDFGHQTGRVGDVGLGGT